MKRSIEISIDAASWRKKAVPAKIQSLQGSRKIDVRNALSHTALWTRPPSFKGFALGDIWAWLRYLPAMGPGPELRLRREWSDIDSHQKSVLSDEVAVGVVTSVLANQLGCIDFVETKHALKTLGRKFSLKPSKKSGPKKSPDYIARLPNRQFLVLECKGTQSSRQALNNALEKGKAQKKNLSSKPSTRVYASVVGGLFIPQFESNEGPLLTLVDPDWSDTTRALEEEPEARVLDALTQVSCAKALAAGGYLMAARALARTNVDLLAESEEAVRDALEMAGPPRASLARLVFEDAEQRRMMLEVVIDANGVAERLRVGSLPGAVRQLATTSLEQSWSSTEDGARASVISPLGVRVSTRLVETLEPLGQLTIASVRA